MSDGYFRGAFLPAAHCPTVNGGGFNCNGDNTLLTKTYNKDRVEKYHCGHCGGKFLHITQTNLWKKL